jgi:hydroxyacylglutathione hydrolase
MGRLVEVTERVSAVQAWESARLGQAAIVDVRGPAEFALGHPRGALSLPFSRKGLEERLGMLLQPGTPVILITDDPGQAEAALSQLRGSAFPVLYVVEGSINAWHESDLPMEILPEVSVYEISRAVPGGNVVVLDVREPIEWETGHVPGAILISLGALRERMQELPTGIGIAVICEAGVRSSSAASILQVEGFTEVSNVSEGTGGYRKAGLPLEMFEAGSDHERIA